MAQWVRQNTAVVIHIGPAIATGGIGSVSALLASKVTKLAVIKHGTLGSVGPTSVTGRTFKHKGQGHYSLSLLSGDTNTLGHFTVYVSATGTTKALPFWHKFHVVPQNIYDSLVSGSAKLNVGTLASGGAVWSATPRTLTSGLQVASSVWAKTVRTLSSAGVVWTAGTRILTSGAVMWTATPRTLTSGKSAACSVWAQGARTLTSGLQVASSVWGHVSGAGLGGKGRYLASGSVIWTAATRTLTSGKSAACSVWAQGTRTLTSGSVMWTAGQTELTAVPAAAPNAGPALMFLYQSARNKRITTATGDKVHTSATVVVATAPISATSTTFTKSKYA